MGVQGIKTFLMAEPGEGRSTEAVLNEVSCEVFRRADVGMRNNSEGSIPGRGNDLSKNLRTFTCCSEFQCNWILPLPPLS